MVFDFDMTIDINICHLVGDLKIGGAERQVVNILNGLKCNKKILIVFQKSPNGFFDDLSDEIEVIDFKVRLRNFPYYIYKLSRFFKKNKINVLHSHMFWSNFYGVTAARLASVPVIVTSEHGKNLWKKRLHKLIEKHLISLCADIRLCVSTDIFNIRRDSDGVPESKLKVLPNSTYLPALNKKRLLQKIAIGAVGRLIDAKDYPTLIQAAAILRRDKISFILYIIGDGPLYPQLANMVERYELNEYVKLTGRQSDVASWLQKLDVFVMSSVREGQPLALLEAMAYQLPVVATRVGGIPETITDGVEGLLVPPGCSESMAAALKRMIQSNALRKKMGVKSREKIEKQYSIESNCSKLMDIYQSILASKIKY